MRETCRREAKSAGLALVLAFSFVARIQAQAEIDAAQADFDFALVLERFNEAADQRHLDEMVGATMDARAIKPTSPIADAMEHRTIECISSAMNRLAVIAHRDRRKLNVKLEQAIQSLDESSGLSESQKQKLRLAGRGDIRHFADRVDQLGESLGVLVRDDALFTEDVTRVREIARLEKDLSAGLFGPGSKFAKATARSLTTEQKAEVRAPIRLIPQPNPFGERPPR